MSRGPAKFTESDIVRILKASAKANVDVRVMIDPDGRIVITTGERAGPPEHVGVEANGAGEWENI